MRNALVIGVGLVFASGVAGAEKKAPARPSKAVAAFRVPTASAVAGADRGTVITKLKDYLVLANKVVEILGEYPKKRAELRALRAKPCPIETGYRPDYFQSAAGLAELEAKARLYLATAKRFFHDTILVERAYINRETREVEEFVDGLGDSAIVTGRYLAGVAYQYGTTGKPEDLQHLIETLTGVYNLMTIAGAPDGYIVHKKTQKRVNPRPGLAARGFGNMASPLVNKMNDLNHDDIYEYHGSLLGLPKAKYHLSSDISRDQMDGLFLGLGAAWEVLKKRNASPEWQKRIADVLRASMLDFVRNGYRFLEFDGTVTRWGNQVNMNEPTVLMHNLGWLGLAVMVTGDGELRGHYNKIANKYFGKHRLFKSGLYGEVLRMLKPALANHEEVILYWVSMFNFNVLAQSSELFMRYAPDAKLREVAIDIHEQLIWPLHKPRRIPWFDLIHMRAIGKPDAEIIARVHATLGQFRREPFPFANPDPHRGNPYYTDYRARTELHDPLYFYLRERWDKDLAKHFPKYKENPFYAGGSIWPLGPGLVFMGDSLGSSSPYYLKSTTPAYWASSEFDPNARLVQVAPHDFITEYWYGRYHGFIGAGAKVDVAPVKEKARTVFGRVIQGIADAVEKLVARVKQFFDDAAMRAKSADKKIRDAVRPLAKKVAGDVTAAMLAHVRTFWSELGPSLTQLPVGVRRDVVDGPWQDLKTAIEKHVASVRSAGVNRVDGWFSKKNRAKGVAAFTSTFDDAVKALFRALDASYKTAME